MLKEASAKEPHYIGLLSDHHIIAPLPSHLRTEGENVKMQVVSSESILKPALKLHYPVLPFHYLLNLIIRSHSY